MRLLCEVKLQSDNDKYHDFIYIRNLKKRTKPNQTHRYREQRGGSKWKGTKRWREDVKVVSGMVMVAN